jgi:origin recognition complex subunit 4
MCLLITAIHSQTSGHDTFTFEMLCQAFRDQVRTSMSAPVQVDGGSVGMVKCGRHILMGVGHLFKSGTETDAI